MKKSLVWCTCAVAIWYFVPEKYQEHGTKSFWLLPSKCSGLWHQSTDCAINHQNFSYAVGASKQSWDMPISIQIVQGQQYTKVIIQDIFSNIIFLTLRYLLQMTLLFTRCKTIGPPQWLVHAPYLQVKQVGSTPGKITGQSRVQELLQSRCLFFQIFFKSNGCS